MAKIYKIALIFLFLSVLPAAAEAASLSFSPSSGSHAVGAALSVNVYVSSVDQPMNAASGIISFPQDKLEVTSLSKAGSIFTLWVQEPSFSNSAGTVNFEGIVLNPGFTGASGKIIAINFKVKAAGTAFLNFSSGSALANDGKGTNILASLGNAQFSLGGAVPAATLGAPSAPQISSPTHPDPNKWYNNSSPKLIWGLSEDITASRVLYDKNSDSRPTVLYDPPISEKEISKIKDGIYYFHVQLKNKNGWGKISHFRFQIDTRPPQPLATEEFIIKPLPAPVLTECPKKPQISFLSVTVPLIALVIILLFVLWYGWHKFSLLRKRLRKEVREAESALHKAFDLLKENIREQIKMLEKTRTKRQLTAEEEKIIKQLKSNLDDAEKFIRKEIEDIEKELK